MQYRHRRVDDPKLIERLKALAAERLRWGWRRLIIMIRREGWTIGERAFRRIYRALGLHVMRTRKRHVRYVRGNSVEAVTLPNERWSLDFMHARLMHGRTYRLLNVVDDFTGETLAIEPAFSFGGADVIRVLENIAYERGLPKTLRSDNGSEFCSHRMLRWSADRNLQWHFIRPGKPTKTPRSNRSTVESVTNSSTRTSFARSPKFELRQTFGARTTTRFDPTLRSDISRRGNSRRVFKLPNPYSFQQRELCPQVIRIPVIPNSASSGGCLEFH